MRLTSGTKALGIKIKTKRGNKVCIDVQYRVGAVVRILEILNILELKDGQACSLQLDYIE